MFSLARYQQDPFRIFFILGGVLGFLGIFPWVLLLFHWSVYPLSYHRMVMIGGFLTSFVTGFLMTAVPRFTQSHYAKTSEILTSFFAIILAYVFACMSQEGLFYIMVFVSHLNLAIFAFKRFKIRQANPPQTFMFMGVGFGLWVLSDVILTLFALGTLDNPSVYLLFKDFWIEGAILSFILGIGGRLLPGILGWTEIMQNDGRDESKNYLQSIPSSLFLMAFLFILSFIVEAFINIGFGLFIRSLVICYFAFRFWRVYKFPFIRNPMTWGIWLAGWCFVLGSLIRVFWLEGGIHAFHMLLVGGISLLTMMIATRVTLAHGGPGALSRGRMRTAGVVAFFVLFSMLTRVIAILIPPAYLAHLAYAAIVWEIAIVIWLMRFYRTII